MLVSAANGLQGFRILSHREGAAVLLLAGGGWQLPASL